MFYMNILVYISFKPNSRTFHEISGENIKFKEISKFLLIFQIQGYFKDILEFQEAAGNFSDTGKGNDNNKNTNCVCV